MPSDASTEQQDVTPFVLGAAMERSRTVLVKEQLLRLSAAEVEQVNAALDAAPSVIPDLARLIREVGRQRTVPGSRPDARS